MTGETRRHHSRRPVVHKKLDDQKEGWPLSFSFAAQEMVPRETGVLVVHSALHFSMYHPSRRDATGSPTHEASLLQKSSGFSCSMYSVVRGVEQGRIVVTSISPDLTGPNRFMGNTYLVAWPGACVAATVAWSI